jgi:hypothetical protein
MKKKTGITLLNCFHRITTVSDSKNFSLALPDAYTKANSKEAPNVDSESSSELTTVDISKSGEPTPWLILNLQHNI